MGYTDAAHSMEQYLGIQYEQPLKCFARPSFLSAKLQETNNVPIVQVLASEIVMRYWITPLTVLSTDALVQCCT